MASQRTASPYIWAIGSAAASSSDATFSWFSARSHWPRTQSSWNRKTRSFASAGAARTLLLQARERRERIAVLQTPLGGVGGAHALPV